MCGIALILSGIRIDCSSLCFDSSCPARHTEKLVFTLEDLKAALRRRGPDSLSSKKLLLQLSGSGQKQISSLIKDDYSFGIQTPAFGLHFIGATLQLRGSNPLVQPLVDASGNILVYNGEIFGGIQIDSDCNDAEFLMQTLANCCFCDSYSNSDTRQAFNSGKSSILDILSMIKGPWAIIYWQEHSRTLWFGRDAFGRRSLLVHWPTEDDSTFLLSSVSPVSPIEQPSDYAAQDGTAYCGYWEELPCGIYSISVDASPDGCLTGIVKRHEYTNSMLKELMRWERTSIEPNFEVPLTCKYECVRRQHDMPVASLETVPYETGSIEHPIPVPAHALLNAIKESVLRRTSMYTIYQAVTSDIRQETFVPVAVLFSGGLDSMILAALLDQCLDPSYEIDLLNVSFDGPSAPDRISAKAGLEELKRVAPSRIWKLVEIDADLSNLGFETNHVMSLINPANTYMDLNIGIALWLAAGGNGWVSNGSSVASDGSHVRIKYKSKARIVLVGSGADEQCAGYGRHRTSYRRGSWLGLSEEMRLDMQRIWKRNLGRDDRCIADNGKEARFPFLDEDVIKILLDMPLWEIANLDHPTGSGDKKILREVAQLLGLCEAAILPKRAIQFGSRIARESNRKNFGSNRAANQASAGSVVIHRKSNIS